MSRRSSFVFVNHPNTWVDYWVLLWCFAGMIGLVYSKFLLSMSIFGISSLILLPDLRGGQMMPSWSRLITDRRQWIGLILLFATVLISGINSTDTGDWLHYIRLRLPMLTIPLALVSVPQIRRSFFQGSLAVFVVTCTVSSIIVTIQYLLDYQEVQAAISRGHPMATPVNHIRYSLMVALSCLFSYLLAQDLRKYRIVLQCISVWLFVFAHILAVRSGIAVLYGAIGILILVYVYRSKRWLQGITILGGMVIALVALVYTIPSLQNKLYYMRHDLHQYFAGDGSEYSDSGRIASLQAGWEVFSTAPVLGVGIGDLGQQIEVAYKTLGLTSGRMHLPHNEWLLIAAAMGLVGVVLTVIGFFWPLWSRRTSYYSLSIISVIALSMVVEHTLESAVGVGLYVLLTSLTLWVCPTEDKLVP